MLFALLIAMTIAAVTGGTTPDRAYGLAGTWSCQSSALGSGTISFTRESDGSIGATDDFTLSGATSHFDELYRLDPAGPFWRWTSTWRDHSDFKEAATGGIWTAQKWFFDGTVTRRPHSHDTETHRIRMIYTWISDSSFEREFEIYEDGVWKTTSSSVCRRSAASS